MLESTLETNSHEPRLRFLVLLLWLFPAAGGGIELGSRPSIPKNRQRPQPGGFFLPESNDDHDR